ncbi:hypothetical protein Tco_0919517 [Tanacetum coccineum]
MATKPKLDADLSGKLVDQNNYHSKIESLMYLTSSRPDIVQAVCYCARYQARPTEKHLKAVKRIFRYLRGIINMGLWYLKDSGFELTACSDADHAGCLDTRKSTSGGIQFLGDKLVSWMLKKQDCTAMSSAEAKFGSALRRSGTNDGVSASFQLKSDSLPHAHAHVIKTYYKHQDSRIKKAQELNQDFPNWDEHQYHIDQMKNFLKSDIFWESRKEILASPHPRKTTPLVQSCQRDPEAPALSQINQDLLYLKKGNSGPKKIVLSLHKFPAIIFNDVDIEEWTSRWVNKCVKKFNPYARYGVEHWKNPHAKIFYIKRQKEPGKRKEVVYSNSKIIQVIKTY